MTQREAVYTRYEKFEEELAHCYFVLHERFISDPSLARFWGEAAMDEMQHYSMLRFCREHNAMADDTPDLKATANIEDLLETVKSLVVDPEISIEEAFYAALLMESSELDEIYERLVKGLERHHPLLLQGIHASLRSHLHGFKEAAERFCKDRGFIEAFRNMGGTTS
jgi:rubrerythrin